MEQAVADNSDVSQAQLDALVADLQEAYDDLKKVESQPDPQPDPNPEQKSEQKPGQKPSGRPNSGLPMTGDGSMLPVVACGVAGIVLVGVSIVVSKRRRAE